MVGGGSYMVETGEGARRGIEMRSSPTNSLIEHLRRAMLLPDCGALSDTVLLNCFVERQDEAAFAALVNRHGPMVIGIQFAVVPPAQQEISKIDISATVKFPK
jgi:hypothetical protein